MQVGINVMGLEAHFEGNVSGIVETAARADTAGIDYVFTSDHLGFSRTAHQSRRETHAFPFALEQDWFEPMCLLSAIASRTSRIRLSTSVLVAPLRPALLLAKQIATLDCLSGGRVTIGLGVGWQEDEYRATGMPFEGRFGDLEQQITALRALWASPPAAARGRSFSFEDFYSLPLPPQGRDLPVILGLGPSERNIARMAKHAQGWTVAPVDRPALRESLVQLRKLLGEQGRDPDAFVVHVGQASIRDLQGNWDRLALADKLAAAAAEGATAVTFMVTDFCRSPDEIPAFLDLAASLRG